MKTKDLYVFDLDGTLSDLTHRLHLVKNTKKPNWDQFYQDCDKDLPVSWVIKLLNTLSNHGLILITSARSDIVRIKTEAWLASHGVPYNFLEMRSDGDSTPDDELKIKMLESFRNRHPNLLVQFIVDDRQRVVDAWRENGYHVLQCNAWKDA